MSTGTTFHHYLDSGGDVQVQLISEGTHGLKRSHVLHVADAPVSHRQREPVAERCLRCLKPRFHNTSLQIKSEKHSKCPCCMCQHILKVMITSWVGFNLKIQRLPSNLICDDYVYIHVHFSMNGCSLDRDD